MKAFIKLSFLLVILNSCSKNRAPFYSSSSSQFNHRDSLTLVNGTGFDLKLYSKKCFVDNPCNKNYSYLWFINGSKTTSKYSKIIDRVELIAVNYNDSSDTLINNTWTKSQIKNHKIILGDQNAEKKIILRNHPDTINSIVYMDHFENEDGYSIFYSTNQEDVSLVKIYDDNQNLIAYGPLAPEYLFLNTKRKKKSYLVKVGIWRYFNNGSIIKSDTIKFSKTDNLIY